MIPQQALARPFPERLRNGPALRWVLADQQPQPASPWNAGGGSGFAVVVAGDVFRGGAVGWALKRARTTRHLLSHGVPDRLADLTGSCGVTVSGDLHVTRDGSLLVAGTHLTGPVMVRLVGRADAGPLRHAARALQVLGGDPVSIPRLVHEAVVDEVAFTVEERRRGRRPHRLGHDLVADTAAQMARAAQVMAGIAPPAMSAAAAMADQVSAVVDLLPAPADRALVGRMGAHATALLGPDRPAGLQHGDLWHHNLLVRHGRVSGIVDWDSWRNAGIPGADVVGLVATHARLASGQAIGAALAARTWRSALPVLARCGIQESIVDALGISWWLTTVAGTLRRVPQRRTDPRWRDATIGQAAGAAIWLS